MKPRCLLIPLLVLLTSMTASAYVWTDANGTVWNFTTSGSTASVENADNYGTAISGTIPADLTIPTTLYVGETPYTVTSIGRYAFWYCSGLTSVTIPESVTSIGSEAFAYCSGLTSITIPESVTSIGSGALSGCYFLRDKFINKSVLISENYWGATLCDEETSDGLLIRDHTVVKCRPWASTVCIPEGVTRIGYEAFYHHSDLTSITIPESVTKISSCAFNGGHLQNILVTCSTPPYLDPNKPFSEPIYYHANLYVPAGSWVDYAYHDYWYKFINIKEIALSQDQVMTRQPVMLMDTRTFAYSVYDPVNEKIGSINPAGIDENNLYHSWQMIEMDGNSFLYNIGAKKFAKRGRIGLEITDTPTPIDVVDGEKGIILGGQSINQWALVTNRSLIADESIITGIGPLLPQEPSPNWYYNLNGQQTPRATKGINIIRLSDGTVKKVMVK